MVSFCQNSLFTSFKFDVQRRFFFSPTHCSLWSYVHHFVSCTIVFTLRYILALTPLCFTAGAPRCCWGWPVCSDLSTWAPESWWRHGSLHGLSSVDSHQLAAVPQAAVHGAASLQWLPRPARQARREVPADGAYRTPSSGEKCLRWGTKCNVS